MVGPIRILDAGCGDGFLIQFIFERLREEFPECRFEVFGFDVSDHGVQQAGFLGRTIARLNSEVPGPNWDERIFALTVGGDWPFEDGLFDFVVSNQVLEHVSNKGGFFANTARCLKENGHSFHLAPLKHCIHEGHIWIPFSHRLLSFDALVGYIKFFSRLGVGKFGAHHRETGIDLDAFARRHADYLLFWCAYSTQSETLLDARRVGLRADFRYTSGFYGLKIRQLLRMKQARTYKRDPSPLGTQLAVRFLRYLSSVTLFIEKKNEY